MLTKVVILSQTDLSSFMLSLIALKGTEQDSLLIFIFIIYDIFALIKNTDLRNEIDDNHYKLSHF